MKIWKKKFVLERSDFRMCHGKEPESEKKLTPKPEDLQQVASSDLEKNERKRILEQQSGNIYEKPWGVCENLIIRRNWIENFEIREISTSQ